MFCIYEVKCDKYYYIGSTVNPRKRPNDHKRSLRLNTHYNPFLQRVYNKHKDFNFTVIEKCENLEHMKEREEYHISYYKETYGNLCMNVLSKYGGGSEWRKYKTPEELKKHDYERTRLTPEQKAKRNAAHKKTLREWTPEQKAEKIKKQKETFRKNGKRCIPFKVLIAYPDLNTTIETYEREQDFFEKTKLEESSLRTLKNVGEKIIKKRLHWTRHNFPVGTVLKIIE